MKSLIDLLVKINLHLRKPYQRYLFLLSFILAFLLGLFGLRFIIVKISQSHPIIAVWFFVLVFFLTIVVTFYHRRKLGKNFTETAIRFVSQRGAVDIVKLRKTWRYRTGIQALWHGLQLSILLLDPSFAASIEIPVATKGRFNLGHAIGGSKSLMRDLTRPRKIVLPGAELYRTNADQDGEMPLKLIVSSAHSQQILMKIICGWELALEKGTLHAIKRIPFSFSGNVDESLLSDGFALLESVFSIIAPVSFSPSES
jgi:hypothetical protein